jgi:hypothetical protein
MRSPGGHRQLPVTSMLLVYALVAFAFFDAVIAQNKPIPKTCYFPDGSPSVAQPCMLDAETSTCCTQGWICLTNGLCKAGNSTQRLYTAQYFRAGCTDKDWKDPACPQICRGRKLHLISMFPSSFVLRTGS